MVLAPHGQAMKCSDTVSPHESSVTNNLFETLHLISLTNSSITYNYILVCLHHNMIQEYKKVFL